MDEGPQTTRLPQELLALTTLVNEDTSIFASGSNQTQLAALNATKFTFDLGKVALP